VRTIWMARLVIAVAVVMVLGAAVFAAYQSGPRRVGLASQARTPDRPAGLTPATTASDRPAGLAPTVTASDQAAGLAPRTTASPRLAPNGMVALFGRMTVSGAVSETRDGTVQFFGGGGGPSCEGQARTFTGLTFFYPTELGSHSELNLRAYLPRGAMGAGTYDVTDLGVDYNPPADSPDSANYQIWSATTVSPAPSHVVLVLRPDASGTLTATGLRPVYVNEPSSHPEDISLSFSCG
jgi:hypothetical protein